MSEPPPPGATRVILIRHGEAVVEAGRICGRLDPPLSPTGRAQIARLARRMAGVEIAAVFSSPARRAAQSARLLVAGRGHKVEHVAALQEIDFGAFEGLTWDEARARSPGICEAWLARPHEVAFPDGECFEDLRSRVLAAMSALRERWLGRTLLVVSHAGVHRAVLADALGAPPAAAFRIDQRLAAASVVDWADGSAFVRTLNLSAE